MRCLLAAALVGCYAPQPPTGAPCPDGICPTGLECSPATQTCERRAIDPVDAPTDDGPVTDDAPIDAPPPAFLYRRRITIRNTAASALPAGFTIRLSLGATLGTLLADAKVKPDLSDLRVVGDGALGERDRIVDPSTGPAPAAVSFSLAEPIASGATSTSYALYYGAPNASAAPANGGAVFALFDEFTSGISSVWLKNDAPTTSAGRLVLRAGATDALATNAATDGVPIVSAVELVASVPDPTSNPTAQATGTFYYWFGYQRTGDFTATDPWVVWIARAKSTVQAEQKSPVGCEAQCTGSSVAQNTASHYFVIERDPGATRFYRDGALSFTSTVTNSTDYSVVVRNFMETSELRVDWIRARARVSPDPAISLAAEESL
jgi:hypothetical protein